MKIRMPRNLSRSCSDLRTIDGLKTFDLPVKLLPRKKTSTSRESNGVHVHDARAQTQGAEKCDTPTARYHRDAGREHVIIIEQVITIHNSGSGDVETVPSTKDEPHHTPQSRDVKGSQLKTDPDGDSEHDDLLIQPAYPHTDNVDLCSLDSFDECTETCLEKHGYRHLPQSALDDVVAPVHTMDVGQIGDRLVDFEAGQDCTENTSTRCPAAPVYRKALTVALCLAVVVALVFSLTVVLFVYPAYRDSFRHYLTGATTPTSSYTPFYLPQPTQTPATATAAATKTLTVTQESHDAHTKPPFDNTPTPEEENDMNEGDGSFQEIPVVRVKLKKIAFNETHSLIYFNSTGKHRYFEHPKF